MLASGGSQDILSITPHECVVDSPIMQRYPPKISTAAKLRNPSSQESKLHTHIIYCFFIKTDALIDKDKGDIEKYWILATISQQ